MGFNKNTCLRIIDANLNRLTEGLRVVEELCRLGGGSAEVVSAVRAIRHSAGNTAKRLFISGLDYISLRDSENDPGRKYNSESEMSRENIENIFRANFKRAQEAARVLEEISKSIAPEFTMEFKELRFRLYSAELNTRKEFYGR